MTKASGRRGQSPDFWWPPPLTHQPLCVNFLWQHLWAIGLWQNRGLNALAIFLPWTWKYLVKVVSPSEQKNPQLNRIGVIDSNVVQLASTLPQYCNIQLFFWSYEMDKKWMNLKTRLKMWILINWSYAIVFEIQNFIEGKVNCFIFL